MGIYGIKPGESYTRWVGLLLSISCTGDTIYTASQVVCIVPMVMHFTDCMRSEKYSVECRLLVDAEMDDEIELQPLLAPATATALLTKTVTA